MEYASVFNLKVPWGHVAAKSWGNKENTRILMVHGTLDNAGTFDNLITLLPQNFYYVCIDLPGHGFSSHFQNGILMDFLNYLLAIKFILDELGWEDLYYIGHSLGGQLGYFFSIIYPGRIKKLVLIDGIIPKIISNDQIISRIKEENKLAIDKCKQKNPYHYTKEQIMHALKYLRGSCLTSKAAEALFERAVTKVDEDSYIYNRDIRVKDLATLLLNLDNHLYLLRQMKTETLLIVATETLQYQKDTYSVISNVLKNHNNINVLKVKGNHDIHNNYPERISEHISTFLTNIPSKL